MQAFTVKADQGIGMGLAGVHQDILQALRFLFWSLRKKKKKNGQPWAVEDWEAHVSLTRNVTSSVTFCWIFCVSLNAHRSWWQVFLSQNILGYCTLMEPTGDLTSPTCIPDDVFLGSLQSQCQEASWLSLVLCPWLLKWRHKAVCLPGLLAGNWHWASTERGNWFPKSIVFCAGVVLSKSG